MTVSKGRMFQVELDLRKALKGGHAWNTGAMARRPESLDWGE